MIAEIHAQLILQNETYQKAAPVVKKFPHSTTVALPKLAVPRTEAIGYTEGSH